MADDKLPPLPPIPEPEKSEPQTAPPPPGAPPRTPPAKAPPAQRSKSGAFSHLEKASKADQLQDFARTGFAGYRRVAVAEKKSRPATLWLLVGFLVLLAAGYALWRWNQPAEIDEVPANSEILTETRTPVMDGSIDPELWRSEIQPLEDYLFAAPSEIGPLGAFGERFGQEAGLFAERLRTEGGPDELALAEDLDGLIAKTERSDFNVRRLKEVRQAWVAIRDYRLGEATWMRDPAAVDESTDLESYRLAAETIQDLLSTTLTVAEDLSSTGMSAEERREEWRATLFYFRDDLKVLRAGLPQRPPAGAAKSELDAIHRLDRLFIEAETIAQRQERLADFDRVSFETAIDNADEAAAFFDRRLGT